MIVTHRYLRMVRHLSPLTIELLITDGLLIPATPSTTGRARYRTARAPSSWPKGARELWEGRR